MLIDWFTVAAQIINFLVLVFLLKHFLYGPIVRAMDKREERIAGRLEEAAQKRAEAEEETETFRRKNREFDAEKEAMHVQAREEAEAWKKQMIKEAREEVDDTRRRWMNAMREGKDAFLRDLRNRAGMQICEIAGRALSDLSGAELQDYMIDVFLENKEKFGTGDLKKIRESARKPGKKVVVTSAFEISAGKRQRITREIHAALADDAEVVYEIAPELVCGIKLRVDGYSIGWNLHDYMKSMEEDIGRTLDEGLES